MAVPPSYDLIIIGAGSAGLAAAAFARRLGVRAALVEQDRVGGDCTWAGCVPSKALLHAAKVARSLRRADAFGLPAVTGKADLRAVMASVQQASERVAAFEMPEVLRKDGVPVITGAAHFLDPHTVAVDGERLHGGRFIICTGAEPALPSIPGLSETPYLTYREVFSLQKLPDRLLVLGGGPVGVELAQAFQRLGAAVTLLEREPRLLPGVDPEAGAVVAAALGCEGVTIQTESVVERIAAGPSGIRLVVSGQVLEGDTLLVATSRLPRLRGLDLERAGVSFSDRGILVDGSLRTSQRHIFAAGDVTGGAQFTHYAVWQGVAAARNALLPGALRGMPATVPTVVFTDPEVAQVGMTEAAARTRWGDIAVQRWPVERIDRAQTAGEHLGFLKLMARPNGVLLGATVVAGAAGEMINQLALVLDHRMTVADLARTVHAYPTYGFGIQQASAEAMFERMGQGWRGALLQAAARWWR